MYKIEIIDKNEFLQAEDIFENYSECMAKYNEVKNTPKIRYKLHGLIMQVFEGQNIEELREIKTKRVYF